MSESHWKGTDWRIRSGAGLDSKRTKGRCAKGVKNQGLRGYGKQQISRKDLLTYS